ncbi:MbnP family protein [Formosa sp. PL04]|uniref:MbnP family protein n=1 Tax=Formosa sp. PL04 TaxID=3081755 RepID=UPI002980D0FB|nr:MbnP family protein [Formosa sp. PL04]MDW5289146.1 MbnP family protein [Formosa sp. PL04]
MKNLKKYLLLAVIGVSLAACSEDDVPVANNVTLEFNNTFSGTPIVLGETENISAEGQVHQFNELKYVISNIRLVKADGTEIPYHVSDLDNGATIVDQSKSETLQYVLSDIPTAEYSQIKFGLGVESALNTLDQVRFPDFYAKAGANDTEMHWEWGTGYRFTKIEGFYDTDNKELSFHSGSTVEGTVDDESTYVPGFDGYRDITLNLPSHAVVGENAPKINIEADFNTFLSGESNKVTLVSTSDITNNATPSAHTSTEMSKFVDNIGGNGTTDTTGMFSIMNVEN